MVALVPGMDATTWWPLVTSALRRGCFTVTTLRSRIFTERGWPVSSKNTVRPPTSWLALAADQRFAPLDVAADLVAELHSIEKQQRRQHADLDMVEPVVEAVQKHLGIHKVRSALPIREGAPRFCGDLRTNLLQIDMRQYRAGTPKAGDSSPTR
jgi:hypothetical protein